MEAVLTRHLKHQSIMRTLTHAWFVATDRGGLGGEQQCWLILEYCDKGSIVVSMISNQSINLFMMKFCDRKGIKTVI